MDAKQDILVQLFQQKEILKSFSKILSAGYNLDKLLETFLFTLQELLKVGRIAILVQEDTGFSVKAYRGIPQDVAAKTLFPIKEGLINYLTVEGTALRLDSLRVADPGVINQLRALGVTTAVPMWEHGRLKAVIVFNNKVVGVPISDEELELVFALGNQLAIAIENATLVDLMSRQRNYLESILANVSSAVISVDNNEIITTYNTKAEEILGISSAEVIGKSVNLLPHDISMLIKETIRSGNPIFRKELKLSGLDKFVGVSISGIRDGHGNSSGAAMIFTDLAPIKALEDQMRRSDRLDFTNTVAMRSSHELKNCLVSIKTFAQLLPERYGDKQFREDFYLVVNKEVDRLNQVVENLLFFAQQLKLDVSSVNIENLIQETIEGIDKEEIFAGVIIKKEFRHHPQSVNIDRDAMRRVLKHLLYNSIQAMPKGGTLHIITASNDFEGKNFLEIKIIDDGIGVPEDIMGKIWEPFFTTKTRGIGLGLTIVQKIIEAHGGSISAVSKPGISGTEFIIRLPNIEEKKQTEKLYFPSGRAVIV
jgi:PAS domain S-box-containing protein